MALDNIRLANKKAKREAKRKNIRNGASTDRQKNRIRQRRMRKMMVQGRREYLQKRRDDKSYIDQLEAEING